MVCYVSCAIYVNPVVIGFPENRFQNAVPREEKKKKQTLGGAVPSKKEVSAGRFSSELEAGKMSALSTQSTLLTIQIHLFCIIISLHRETASLRYFSWQYLQEG